MSHSSEKDPPIPSVSSEFKKTDIGEQKQEKVFFGVDLGGTRTRVSMVRPRKHAEGYDVDAITVADIPSVVSFLKDERCVVGWAAERRKSGSPLNTFYNMQRLIGRRFVDYEVHETIKEKHVGYEIRTLYDGCTYVQSSYAGWPLCPAEIQALILFKIKELCEIEFNTPMKNIVITVPYYFRDPQKHATIRAASIAGLNVVAMVTVPAAAIITYHTICNYSNSAKTVLVYDFGGSSFEASVVKFAPQSSEQCIEVLGTKKSSFLGGDDFDNIIFNVLVTALKHKTGFKVEQLNADTVQCIRSTAKNAKMDLSYHTEVEVTFWGLLFNSDPRDIIVEHLTVKLTRSMFEKSFAKLIGKTLVLSHIALEYAKKSVSEIDDILAIGGTCRIPQVRAAIKKEFGKEPLAITRADVNCANIAVVGAALGADVLCSESSNDSQQQPAQQQPAPQQPARPHVTRQQFAPRQHVARQHFAREQLARQQLARQQPAQQQPAQQQPAQQQPAQQQPTQQQPDARLIQLLSKVVQEYEAFDLGISDVVDLNPEEKIFQNLPALTKSCYLPIWYTTEYADSLVYRMLQNFPLGSEDLDDESRDCNELRQMLTNEKRMDCDLTRATTDRITRIKEKKDELVKNELFRMVRIAMDFRK